MRAIAGGIDKHTPADGTFIGDANLIIKMVGINVFDVRAVPGAICDRMAIQVESLVEPTLPKVCEPFARATIPARTWNLAPRVPFHISHGILPPELDVLSDTQ